MKKLTTRYLYCTLYIGLAVSFSSCISTEIMEPTDSSKETKEIVLELSAETKGLTRADSDHKLRFVAKLFQGSLNNINSSTMIRKELLAGEKDEGEVNQIIFNVPAGYTYSILVFADYVPQSNITSSGITDHYYNTQIKGSRVEMYTTPEKSIENFSADFFNNDNYDCFSAAFQVEKTEKKFVFSDPLERAVAKVRFVDQSSTTGNYNVSVSKVGNYKYFDINTNGSTGLLSYNSNSGFSELNLPGTKNFTNNSDKEVIFYYTFASPASTASTQHSYIIFTVKDQAGHWKTIDTGSNKVEIRQNYITTVSGNILPESSTGSGNNNNSGWPEEPGIGDDSGNNSGSGGNGSGGNGSGGITTPEDGTGPIILDLSIAPSWSQSTQNWED